MAFGRLIDLAARRFFRAVGKLPAHWDAGAVRTSIDIDRETARLHAFMREQTPGNPALFGFKAYSQSDEDGIIQHLLEKISLRAPLARTCIEFGASNGLENNTHYLLLNGFRGFWVEGSRQNIDSLRDVLGGTEFGSLQVVESFVTMANLAGIVARARGFLGEEIDLLSIDLDGNDLYFHAECLKHIRPKIIVAEYNPRFRPPMRMVIPYNEAHVWEGDDYYGASLMSLVDTLQGYRLVSCNLAGCNAFFVREDLADAFPRYEPAELYQPSRLYMIWRRGAEEPSLKFLKARLLDS
jgi:hypothetical protein